nr:MAG: major capsid protein [Microvirus sp.]
MTRNATSHFNFNPTSINMSRSTFSRSSSLKTSFNVGNIIPIYCDEVLPGDTFDIKTSKVVRLQTLITPIMDNLYLDTYFFFVPNRLVWEHWQEFMGENTSSAWIPSVEYEIPQLTAPASTGWTVGTIADYFGIPTGIANLSVNALPFRAYALIVNDWFRDENLSNPLNIPVTDTTVAGVNTGTFVTDIAKGGLPYKAAKYHDYFTSALPGPQKGPNVSIGMSGEAPVFGNGLNLGLTPYSSGNRVGDGLMWKEAPGQAAGTAGVLFIDSDANGGLLGSTPNTPMNVAGSGGRAGVITKAIIDAATGVDYSRTGLIADLGLASAISVNSLRLAFQIQKLYERDSRGGSRYIELLKSHFGVTSPDARLQRPEYLGGNRLPININQVVQQSETATTPQGNVSGYSVTTDCHSDFTKSFVEHGFVIGLAVVRYDHTYQNGIQRFWSRKDRFDYYWPVLANIGEQPILNKEIYAQGTTADDEVFGYQEAWADYRYKPSIVTGEMRSAATTPLDSWHLADEYSTLPLLSSSWISEDKTNVDRVLAVQSTVSNQLFGDFYFQCKTTRPMPLYSIPGLIDHN